LGLLLGCGNTLQAKIIITINYPLVCGKSLILKKE